NIGSFTPRTTGNLFFGRRAAVGFEETFLGTLDEPAVYSRELSSTEILSIFNSDTAGKCKTPLPLEITSEPQSQPVLIGSNAVLAVAVLGTPPFSYQWQKGDALIDGATSAFLLLPAVQPSDGGNYS